MSGFGETSMGEHPFGLGSLEEAAIPAAGPTGSRYIDAVAGNYRLDDTTGHFAQMPPLRQRVLLILATVHGSSTAAPTLGIRVPRVMGSHFEQEMKAAVRFAFRQLTDVEAVMRIDDILVQRSPTALGRAEMTLSYTDLSTGRRDDVRRSVG
jgi:phage baseplate assembly protein W